ncbi:MAG TPA: hypothetical protein VLT47_07430 [Anaeromyxobacteraceae bacterium]|nr:hypothetical protein [Anaeromyxobacteraceae bacterium]
MPTPAPNDPKRDDTRRLTGRIGSGLFAFGVFVSGYMAMKTSDWRQVALWTVIAAGCAWFASRLAAMGR